MSSTRRKQLMRPAQLLGIAFVCAAFAGGVTFFVIGGAQEGIGFGAMSVALIVGGVTFIAVLLVMSLLLLAIDPAEIENTVDRGVLLPEASAHPEPAVGAGDDIEPTADDVPGGPEGAVS